MSDSKNQGFFGKISGLISATLALLMILSLILTGCTPGKNQGDTQTEHPSGEYTLERGENEKQITFYFKRSSGKYDDCDIWLWHDQADGRGYIFHECPYGAKVVVNVPESVNKVGFIVRTGCSDPGGSSWGSATKDATEEDRFAELTGADTVYYLKSGDPMLYVSEDAGLTLKPLRSIVMGDLADSRTVKFALNVSMKVTPEMITVRSGDGKIIGIESVDSPGGMLGTVTLKEALDITKIYTIGIDDMEPVKIMPNTYFSSAEFAENYVYNGELGVIFEAGSIRFTLWAPTASKVVLNIFENGSGGSALQRIDMTRGEKGVWSYVAPETLSGKYYTYSVTTAVGEQEAVDPYARSAGLNGKRGMILDLSTTDPVGWSEDRFDPAGVQNYTDAVIWEVHVRDFSVALPGSQYKGKYLAFTETGLKNSAGIPVGLDYLKELGITHVHLMPVYDYASVEESGSSGYNWGYDPQNYNVPEGSYATDPADGAVRVNEFKRMVQALHEAGIGVVMDVVYNHTYDANSNLNKVTPYYYYRYNGNGSPSNGSGCGNETASDRAMFRKYMIDSLTYWMTEYHLDGFRFDLMGLHDVETMKKIEKAVHAINPKALLYGEGWTGGTSVLPTARQSTLSNLKKVNEEKKTNGIAMFNDVLRDAVKGSTNGSDTGFATGARSSLINRVRFGVCGGAGDFQFTGHSNGWSAYDPTNMINYVSAHDNLALWDKICYAYGENETTLEMRLKRNALSGAIVATSLGVPFMQAGEEMLRTKKNADGTYNHNSYNAGDAVNHINWEALTETSPEYRMMQYYRGLIAFRKSSVALRAATAKDGEGNLICKLINGTGTLLAFTVSYGGETLCVIYNAGETSASMVLPEGNWDLYVNGNNAGTGILQSNVSGSVTIDAVSCFVYRLS